MKKLNTLDPNSPITVNTMSRRMFVRGSGSLLAIPFLPSLVERAYGQSSQFDGCLIFTNVSHGCTHPAWAPSGAPLTQVGNHIRAAKLSSFAGGLGRIVGNRFNDMLSKISILQGLDHNNPSNHYWFPWSASQGVHWESIYPSFPYSIDYVLSQSKKIYPQASSLDVLRIDPREAYHTYSFLGKGANGVAKMAGAEGKTVTGTWSAISQYINPGSGGSISPMGIESPAAKKYLVDQFLAETSQVINSRKLSSEDKVLLQNFNDQLHEVQKKIPSGSSETKAGAQCEKLNITEPSDNKNFNRRLLDIMVVAMSCGITRLGTYHFNWKTSMDDSDLGNRYHPNVHGICHTFNQNAQNYQSMLKWWGTALDHYAYLVRRLDQVGLLDKSVVVFTSDMATSTYGHHGVDKPILTAGSLGGRLRTGELISYHNLSQELNSNVAWVDNALKPYKLYGGRRYNEFLITLMTAAGLSPSDYEKDGNKGFGTYACRIENCGGAEGGLNGKLSNYQNSPQYPNQDPRAPLPYYFNG